MVPFEITYPTWFFYRSQLIDLLNHQQLLSTNAVDMTVKCKADETISNVAFQVFLDRKTRSRFQFK